MSRMVI